MPPKHRGTHHAIFLVLITLLLAVRYPQSVVAAQTGLRQVSSFGKGSVTGIALSPDRKTLAIDGSAGTWLYNVAALNSVPRLMVSKPPPTIAYFPQRKVIVSGADPQQRAWDAPPPPTPCPAGGPCSGGGGGGGGGGESPPTGFGTQIAFSPDSSKLLAPGDGGLWLWDLNAEHGEHILEQSEFGQFSPDGSMVIGRNGWWDTANHQKLANFPGIDLFRTDLIFSPDGRTVGAWDWLSGKLILLDVGTGSQRSISDGSGDIAFSPDGHLLAYRSSQSVKIVEAASGQEVQNIPEDISTSPAFSPDGALLAIGVWDNSKGKDVVQVWDIAAKTMRSEMVPPDDYGGIEKLAFTPDGSTLAVSYFANVSVGAGRAPNLPIVLWDVSTARLKATLLNDNGQLNTRIEFTSQGIALTVDSISVVRLWNMITGKLLGKITGYGGALIEHVAYTPQGKLLVSTDDTYTRTLSLLDPKTGQSTLNTAILFGDYVISPDGSMFTSTDSDTTSLELWRIQPNSKPIQLLKGIKLIPDSPEPLPPSDRTVATFSPDNQWLAAKSPQGVHLFETKTGKEQTVFPITEGGIREMLFSPDSTLLAVRGPSGAVLWDLTAQRVILKADLPDPQTMTFSADGALFVLAGSAPEVRVWETTTGNVHSYPTSCHIGQIAFIPNTEVLIAACYDGKIVTMPVSVPIAQASAAPFNQFTASRDGKLFTFVAPDAVYHLSDPNTAPFYYGIALWDSMTRQPVPGIPGGIVAFSPDGSQLAMGGSGVLDIWSTADK